MPEYNIKICDVWNGQDNVCDLYRCKERLSKTDDLCYHKPIEINDELFTVIGALEKILTENKGRDSVGINGQQYTLIKAIEKVFMIS